MAIWGAGFATADHQRLAIGRNYGRQVEPRKLHPFWFGGHIHGGRPMVTISSKYKIQESRYQEDDQDCIDCIWPPPHRHIAYTTNQQ